LGTAWLAIPQTTE
jgi:hypothetical protein